MAQRGFVSSGGGEDFDSLEVDRVEVVGNAPIGFLIEQVACNQPFQDCQDCLFRSRESFFIVWNTLFFAELDHVVDELLTDFEA